MKQYERVSLGELLTLERRPVEVFPEKQYAEIGIYCFGRGIFHKTPRSGAEVGDKSLFLIKNGDFILQITFAWEGAVALASQSEDGMYGSVRFPTFRLDEKRCYPPFMFNYFKTKEGIEQLGRISPGSADRNRVLSLKRIADVFVPLPPLDEQCRIVARIDELAAKIEAARSLRQEAMRETESVVQNALHQAFETNTNDWKPLPMEQAIAINDRQVDPTLPEYAQLPHISGENIESKTCKLLPYRTAEQDGVKSGNYLFSPGTILYSKIRPYLQKAVFVDFRGVCSADIYPVKVINENLEPRFVMWSFVAGPFAEYANRLSGRTRMPKLNRKQLFDFTFSHPDIQTQQHIVSYLDDLRAKVDALKQLQAETAAELDALLPSILDKAFKGEL